MGASSHSAGLRDVYPDTWVATDGLGRRVSTAAQVDAPREGKFVGMFYFLWLGAHGVGGPHDITKILAADQDALSKTTSPPWGKLHAFHHWGESLFGYYLSDDQWVLRKHAGMLSDAGVDVVIFDVTNQATYPSSYLALCEAWTAARRDGNRTPQIAFLCPFGNPRGVVDELYRDFYSKGLYSDLWFLWKGKPLIMADPAMVSDEVKGFFTYRKPQPSYFEGPTGPDQWGWLEVHPQHVFYNSNGDPEQMTVGVAQNSQNARRLASMSEKNVTGRSWHSGRKDERPGAVNLGLNFAEQWERALTVDPEFIFITGWNEWVAMWLNDFGGVQEPVMFVDQFDHEYSRDIEPMRGGHWDAYYYQTVDFIRQYKGARPAPKAGPEKTIAIDGRFDDWKDVRPEYRDGIGDTMHRDHPGWGDAGRYVNTTGRNDIVETRVARDARNVYFYVRTRQPLTPHTDPNWMLLFINADGRWESGWEGYNFIVNRALKNASTSVLERSSGGWVWEAVCDVKIAVRGAEMELSIPRSSLGLEDLSRPLRFEFKWADNIQNPGDPMEFTVNGDAAPNGRFNYLYQE